jgi:hypothetical protein
MSIEQQKVTVPIEQLRVQVWVLQALIYLHDQVQSDAPKEQRRSAAVLRATTLLREMAGEFCFADDLVAQVNELACLVEYLAL